MKKLDTSAISLTNRMPLKQGSIQFLQDAYTEIVKDTIISLIGASYSPSVPYILYGVVHSISGPNDVFTEGAIFFNGEIFHSPTQSVVTIAGTMIANILTTQYTTNADAVTFSDATPRNVHNIRTCSFLYGTSGTGNIGDYSDFISYNIHKIIDNFSSLTYTVTTDSNKYYILGNFHNNGASTIIIDTSNAKIGAEINILIGVAASGDSLTISMSGSTYVAYYLTGANNISGPSAAYFVRIKILDDDSSLTVELFKGSHS